MKWLDELVMQLRDRAASAQRGSLAWRAHPGIYRYKDGEAEGYERASSMLDAAAAQYPEDEERRAIGEALEGWGALVASWTLEYDADAPQGLRFRLQAWDHERVVFQSHDADLLALLGLGLAAVKSKGAPSKTCPDETPAPFGCSPECLDAAQAEEAEAAAPAQEPVEGKQCPACGQMRSAFPDISKCASCGHEHAACGYCHHHHAWPSNAQALLERHSERPFCAKCGYYTDCDTPAAAPAPELLTVICPGCAKTKLAAVMVCPSCASAPLTAQDLVDEATARGEEGLVAQVREVMTFAKWRKSQKHATTPSAELSGHSNPNRASEAQEAAKTGESGGIPWTEEQVTADA